MKSTGLLIAPEVILGGVTRHTKKPNPVLNKTTEGGYELNFLKNATDEQKDALRAATNIAILFSHDTAALPQGEQLVAFPRSLDDKKKTKGWLTDVEKRDLWGRAQNVQTVVAFYTTNKEVIVLAVDLTEFYEGRYPLHFLHKGENSANAQNAIQNLGVQCLKDLMKVLGDAPQTNPVVHVRREIWLKEARDVTGSQSFPKHVNITEYHAFKSAIISWLFWMRISIPWQLKRVLEGDHHELDVARPTHRFRYRSGWADLTPGSVGGRLDPKIKDGDRQLMLPILLPVDHGVGRGTHTKIPHGSRPLFAGDVIGLQKTPDASVPPENANAGTLMFYIDRYRSIEPARMSASSMMEPHIALLHSSQVAVPTVGPLADSESAPECPPSPCFVLPERAEDKEGPSDACAPATLPESLPPRPKSCVLDLPEREQDDEAPSDACADDVIPEPLTPRDRTCEIVLPKRGEDEEEPSDVCADDAVPETLPARKPTCDIALPERGGDEEAESDACQDDALPETLPAREPKCEIVLPDRGGDEEGPSDACASDAIPETVAVPAEPACTLVLPERGGDDDDEAVDICRPLVYDEAPDVARALPVSVDCPRVSCFPTDVDAFELCESAPARTAFASIFSGAAARPAAADRITWDDTVFADEEWLDEGRAFSSVAIEHFCPPHWGDMLWSGARFGTDDDGADVERDDDDDDDDDDEAWFIGTRAPFPVTLDDFITAGSNVAAKDAVHVGGVTDHKQMIDHLLPVYDDDDDDDDDSDDESEDYDGDDVEDYDDGLNVDDYDDDEYWAYWEADWHDKHSGELYRRILRGESFERDFVSSLSPEKIGDRQDMLNVLHAIYADVPAFPSTSMAFTTRVRAMESALSILEDPMLHATSAEPLVARLADGHLAALMQLDHMNHEANLRSGRRRRKRRKRRRRRKKRPRRSRRRKKKSKKRGRGRAVTRRGRSAVKGAKKGFKRGIKGAKRGLKRGAKGAKRGLKRGAKGIKRGAKGAKRGLKRGVKGARRGVKRGVKGAKRGIKRGVKGARRGVRRGVKGAKRGIKRGVKGARRGVKRGVKGVRRGARRVKKGAKRGLDKIRGRGKGATGQATGSAPPGGAAAGSTGSVPPEKGATGKATGDAAAGSTGSVPPEKGATGKATGGTADGSGTLPEKSATTGKTSKPLPTPPTQKESGQAGGTSTSTPETTKTQAPSATKGNAGATTDAAPAKTKNDAGAADQTKKQRESPVQDAGGSDAGQGGGMAAPPPPPPSRDFRQDFEQDRGDVGDSDGGGGDQRRQEKLARKDQQREAKEARKAEQRQLRDERRATEREQEQEFRMRQFDIEQERLALEREREERLREESLLQQEQGFVDDQDGLAVDDQDDVFFEDEQVEVPRRRLVRRSSLEQSVPVSTQPRIVQAEPQVVQPSQPQAVQSLPQEVQPAQPQVVQTQTQPATVRETVIPGEDTRAFVDEQTDVVEQEDQFFIDEGTGLVDQEDVNFFGQDQSFTDDDITEEEEDSSVVVIDDFAPEELFPLQIGPGFEEPVPEDEIFIGDDDEQEGESNGSGNDEDGIISSGASLAPPSDPRTSGSIWSFFGTL